MDNSQSHWVNALLILLSYFTVNVGIEMFSFEINKEQWLAIHHKCSGLSFNSSTIRRKKIKMLKFSEIGVLTAFSN